MTKLVGLFILFASLALAAVFVGQTRKLVLPPPPTLDEPVDPPVSEEEAPAIINPLSLEAARAKVYDGRDLTLGKVLARNTSYTRYALTYKSGTFSISGIMNIPTGNGPFPVIITNHGYIDPAVYTTGRGLKREQDYLARHGFAVLHPDYRCHASSDCPGETSIENRLGYVDDVINAIKAVQGSDLSQLDKKKIGMLGHSLGGGIAYSVSVIIDDIDSFVLFAPISPDTVDVYNKWLKERPEVVEEVREAYGEPEENPEFWRQVSSITYFDRVNAPMQIHHGTADKDVPLEWSEKSVNRLRELRKRVELFVYPNEPHEFAAAWPLVMQRTVSFFRQNLK